MEEYDEKYMKKALKLAKKGVGSTSPNPMVGSVIVKNGKIIGEGYHEKYGELHAERNALKNCTESASGATMYVTLEPCCHYGKTPPCTEAIIENNIKRVVVGCVDDNPLVENKGIKILKEHGIEVDVGVLENECKKINEVFFHYILTKTPFVAMKYAMTLDGKIATFSGDSKWITSDETRKHVHKLRNRYKAIMVGINTVLCDNPMLNCRIDGGVDPIRIILDRNLRLPLDGNIVKTADKISTIVITSIVDSSDNCKLSKIKDLNDKNIEIIQENDLKNVMKILGKKEIDSILVEGGGTIHATMLENGLVNKVYAYIAPKLIGGSKSQSPVKGKGVEKMSQAIKLRDVEYTSFGDDILITGYTSIK